ncbi:DUF3618 domain-containing protein [Patulibacter brassicae]|jgi:hypothetical protein|uniref:DUF3618 domain-containing protein n=1 Tax=Patulibacter brassicae TaxID=1705717 RepID=A0ABU4VMD8_9ACTN|nr:DUF3618 domain-containing protein [Patulibacter brassicae]MDX8152963.1 DUF3618 domain-containing protein [Patulibacter brassicae]
MSTRTPAEIRASLEEHRRELSNSIELLRSDVTELSDWRRQVQRHRTAVLVAASVGGFVLAGGIGVLTGRRRRR